MRLILLGAPGSGKGTQAKLLSERLGLEHIGTGDILREAIRLDSPAGQRARPYVEAGQLVPDDLVNELVADRLRRDDRPEKFIMDGYPRNRAQGAAFDALLARVGLDLTAVVHLVVDEDEIARRVSGRARADDGAETVRKRLQIYRDETKGLVPYYQAKGLLREVPGKGSIEDIYNAIVRAVSSPQAGSTC